MSVNVVLVGGSCKDQLALLPQLSFADAVTLIVPESPNANLLRQAPDRSSDQPLYNTADHHEVPVHAKFVFADLARVEGKARVGDTLRQMEAPDLLVLLSAPLANHSLLRSEASDLTTELARSVDGWAYVCRAAIPEMQRCAGKPCYILGLAALNTSVTGAHGHAITAWQQTFLAALEDELQRVGSAIKVGFGELTRRKESAQAIGGPSSENLGKNEGGGNVDLANWFASITAG